MTSDDLEPGLEPGRPPAGPKNLDAKNLDVMSVEALRGYAAELKAEMVRVEAAITGKEAARRSADSFFTT